MTPAREDDGQAAVELALVLPLVCLLLLAVVQIGLVVHTQLVVAHAAREGARAAAVDEHPLAAEAAVVAGTPLDRDRVAVDARTAGERVEVEVRYQYPTDLPLIGVVVPDVELSATATMRREE
ncbi:MAG: TadE family type IV pilus minor pilin [Acidimicrobiales bacterium]